ncbi:hypothetical protein VMCG_01831 [Cytospora schulzeri]|uniref:Expansin-like EG45 domain-containing protein n=1 Tax=Cytospora schulzeri TaxID=448051 RepID=A0A423X2M1_9PEZI|nr:hypothetical protein VMCG_01831 [Valsa malicola]
MDLDTMKQVDMQNGARRDRRLEEMPSLQTLEGTTISALSRDYQHGGYQAAYEQELHVLSQDHQTSAMEEKRVAPGKHEWMRQDRQGRKCIILEAVIASIVVIGIVLGAVLGTQLSSYTHHGASVPSPSAITSPSSTAGLTPSADTVPIGTTFNVSIAVGGICTGSQTCASPASGGYTAGVSQNLYGSGTDSQAWSCGTCWLLTTLWDVNNSSSIVVTVVTDCPATTGNDLCMMKTLDDENVHEMNVDVDLCPESGAPEALLGSEQLGLGKAMRVEC